MTTSIVTFVIGIFWILVALVIMPKTQKKENLKETCGTLVGFREHFTKYYYKRGEGLSERRSYFKDFQDNGKGRLPVVVVNFYGERQKIEAQNSVKELSSADIGKQLKVLYTKNQFGGVILFVSINDDATLIKKYNKKATIGKLAILGFGILFVMLGIITFYRLDYYILNVISRK